MAPMHGVSVNFSMDHPSHRVHTAQQLLERAQVLTTWLSTGYPEKPSDEELQDILLDIGDSLGKLAATLPAPVGRTVQAPQVLTRAKQAIGERGRVYGPHGEGLERVAHLWTALLGQEVRAHEVALCMAALKLARIHASEQHLDSWIDATAYLSLGAELAGATEEP